MNSKTFRPSLALALIIAVIVGFLAGVVGELWINQFLAPDIQFKDYRDLTKRLDELTTQQQKELKDLLSEQDFSINKVIERVKPTLVTFYDYKKPGNRVNDIYLLSDLRGSGFILTSDGWLVTVKRVIEDDDGQYVARVNNEIYPIESIVPDTMTDAVFVKISANNLPVVDLGAKNQLNVAQTVLVASSQSGITRTTIDNLFQPLLENESDIIHSSESYYRYILLNNNINDQSAGAPIFNLEGKVVGVLLGNGNFVLPIDYFSRVIKSAVQQSRITRNLLGVHYLDLEQALNFQSEYKKGALLTGNVGLPAVVANSPAADAGLKVGDLIIKVENEEVNQLHSLSQLIQEYQPGSSVNLTVIKDGQEQQISVTLGQL